MNIILFYPEEVEHPLPRSDARAQHLLGVLRLATGGSFDAGLINGPLGKGTLIAADTESLVLSFTWGNPPPPLCAIHLLVGLPRPQTARDILRDLTTLGVSSIHFVRTERGEASYSNSSLWRSNEWKNCVINGATQAFCTRLPAIIHDETLSHALAALPTNVASVVLDNYESAASLTDFNLSNTSSVVLAVGSERGWSPSERTLFRTSGFGFVHLGTRVMRTETACVAAVTLLKSKLGWF